MTAPYVLTISPVVSIETNTTNTPDQQLVLTLLPVLKGDTGSGSVVISAISSSLSNTDSAVSSISSSLSNNDIAISSISSGLSNSISLISSSLSSTNSTLSVVSSGLSTTDSTVSSLSSNLSNTNSTLSNISSGLSDINLTVSVISSGLSSTLSDVASINTQLPLKADLVNGVVPASQLPSYVDDVLEYPSLSDFPSIGESGKIYLADDTNVAYRWGGSSYVAISPSLALGNTSSTAFRGDQGLTAYNHSQTIGNPHSTVISDIAGLESYLSTVSSGLSVTNNAVSSVSTGLSNTTSSVSAVSSNLSSVSSGLSSTNSSVSSISSSLSDTNTSLSAVSSGMASKSLTIVTKTANYTITSADNGKTFLFTGGNPTFSSVASLGSGFNCTIINLVGVTAFTITANTGDTFDGGLSSFQIKNLQGVQIFCDGTYLRLGLGKAPILYSEYATAGTTRPSASGSKSVAIGSGAASNGSDSFAEGTGALALGTKSIAIGSSATATNANDMAFGYGASTAGTNSNANSAIAMGVNAKTTQAGEFSWCIGDQNFLSNRMQLSAFATAASTNYPLVAKPSGGGISQQTYNQIPVLANGTTTFSGIVTVKQKNANGQNMMAWRIEGVAWGDSFGANVTLVSSTITAMAGMTAPTGWGLTLAADSSRMCVAVTFNMGSTAMNLTAFADITIEKWFTPNKIN